MKFLPGIGVAKLSGTIGGVTAQSWRGLGVFRTKPIPTKALTPRQTVINLLMATLSIAWRDELNKGQRTAWNQRAKNFPWVDVFGNERKMTGENLYIKQNMVLLDHSLVRQDNPVPETVPPELLDLGFDSSGTVLTITIPQLSDAIVLSQTPFIDIFVANGFTSIDVSGLPEEVIIDTLALPAGRTYQKSDFRHAVYYDNTDTTLGVEGVIQVQIPAGQTRNTVVHLRRYNKFGNFTAPLIFEDVITRP